MTKPPYLCKRVLYRNLFPQEQIELVREANLLPRLCSRLKVGGDISSIVCKTSWRDSRDTFNFNPCRAYGYSALVTLFSTLVIYT
jgi:hypothetical protein